MEPLIFGEFLNELKLTLRDANNIGSDGSSSSGVVSAKKQLCLEQLDVHNRA